MTDRKSQSDDVSGHDVPEDEGFLERWSRRKTEARLTQTQPQTQPQTHAVPPIDTPRDPADDAGSETSETTEEPGPLTDTDMPALDDLHEDSDYSPFLAAGVSPGLRRKALRQLFQSAKFNVIDGLDDYCEDLTTFEPLGDIVTADMKARAESLIRDTLAGGRPADVSDPDTGPGQADRTPQQVGATGSEDEDAGQVVGADDPSAAPENT